MSKCPECDASFGEYPGQIVFCRKTDPGRACALSVPGQLEQPSTPIPMRLRCEVCHELHIDEGEFATKPHHTHACQYCGAVWRPAIGPTIGVQFLPGFKNQ